MPTPNRVSLTSIAEDDTPIQRMDLMAPSIPSTAQLAVEESASEPVSPVPTPITPPATKSTRIVRQSREVAESLQPAGSNSVLQLAQQMYGNQEEKDQISAWVKRWVNQGLEAAVRDAEAKGYKKMTKSTIIETALVQFLGLTPPVQ
jgi:hypothetical protein